MSIPRYESCLVWATPTVCQFVKERAVIRDGVDLDIDGAVMFFPDKFTFDHIMYHYGVKSSVKPLVMKVTEV